MKRIQGYLWPTLLALAVAIGVYIGGKLHFAETPEKLFMANSKKDKLNRLIDYIDREYVDEVNTDSIVDVTVNNILGKLDPHSVYISKSEMEAVSENMKGDFAGIGVSFYRVRDTITVIRSIKNGPSHLQGIKPGDRILMADRDTLYGPGTTNEGVVSTLKGKLGTKVALKVYRKANDSIFQVTVRRDMIPIRSVEGYYMLKPDMGYIKINRFAESTYGEFKDALNKLKLRGAQKLVLDLRDNPGGYLGIAEKMVDEFLTDDKLILFTKNKDGKVKKVFATSKGDFENRPVYVLINERSASASEIIAGALQDNDVGTIVGRRSFGKGLVQREMDLGDGSAVRLTVSRYYTPTGRSIQRSYENGNRDYYNRFLDRYNSGELSSPDSIEVNDSLRFVTPKGKVVYGGGGIVPDVFVPIGSNEEEAIQSMDGTFEFFNRFVFDHLEEDRTRYQDYSPSEFMENFRVDDILFDRFIQFVLDRKVRLDFYAQEDRIKAYIKANLAEQLFSPNLSAQIKGEYDAMLTKVKELDSLAMAPMRLGALDPR